MHARSPQRGAPRPQVFGNVNREPRPLCRPYRTWLGCCSPDKHAGQFAWMQDCGRKLSEPSTAGHISAASLCIQRMTSSGDSDFVRIISMCVTQHTGPASKTCSEKTPETSILPYYFAFRDRN